MCYFSVVANLLTISEISRRSGVAASALRFYEEKGLIKSTLLAEWAHADDRPVARGRQPAP